MPWTDSGTPTLLLQPKPRLAWTLGHICCVSAGHKAAVIELKVNSMVTPRLCWDNGVNLMMAMALCRSQSRQPSRFLVAHRWPGHSLSAVFSVRSLVGGTHTGPFNCCHPKGETKSARWHWNTPSERMIERKAEAAHRMWFPLQIKNWCPYCCSTTDSFQTLVSGRLWTAVLKFY